MIFNDGTDTTSGSNTSSNSNISKSTISSSGNTLPKNLNVKDSGNINLNTPQFNISIPSSSLKNLAAAGAASGGAAVAAKGAQKFPGSPLTKAAVGAGTFILTNAAAAITGRYWNEIESKNSNSSSNSNSKSNSYIIHNDSYNPNILSKNNVVIEKYDGIKSINGEKIKYINKDNYSNLSVSEDSQTVSALDELIKNQSFFNIKNPDKYSDYPLNLLIELNKVIDAEILFMIGLIYILIVQIVINYLNKKPLKFTNKKIERVLLFILNRYNLSWSKYAKFFRIYIIIMLSTAIILSKFCIYLILTT
jgi:hypothetical protein